MPLRTGAVKIPIKSSIVTRQRHASSMFRFINKTCAKTRTAPNQLLLQMVIALV
jgi:hypothetical protein